MSDELLVVRSQFGDRDGIGAWPALTAGVLIVSLVPQGWDRRWWPWCWGWAYRPP